MKVFQPLQPSFDSMCTWLISLISTKPRSRHWLVGSLTQQGTGIRQKLRNQARSGYVRFFQPFSESDDQNW